MVVEKNGKQKFDIKSIPNNLAVPMAISEYQLKSQQIWNEKYIRPNEVNYLLGNPNKAKDLLDWKPKVSFEDLAVMMVESDLKLAEQEKVLLEKNLISKTWED